MTYFCSMITSTYPNESSGVTDWHRNVGRAIRTDGCVFFLCTGGRARILINMRKRTLRRGCLLVLSSNVYLSVSEVSADFSLSYVSLSKPLIEAAYYKITSMSLWESVHYAPVMRLSPAQQRLLAGWMEQVEWILANTDGAGRVTLLNNSAYNLFIAIDVELSKLTGTAVMECKDRAWEVSCQFWSLLAGNVLQERKVAFYADALHISPDYLNKVCRKAYGMSAKGLIEQQLVVEIKSYLTDTRLPVTAIARRMNFEDASYMCRFFRRETGCSPMEFRNGELKNR